MVTIMLPDTILDVLTEENTKHFKCVPISMFMKIMQMSLRVSDSLHFGKKVLNPRKEGSKNVT